MKYVLAFAITLMLAGCAGGSNAPTLDQVLQVAQQTCGWVSDDNNAVTQLIASYPPATPYVTIGKAICDAFTAHAGGQSAPAEAVVNGVKITGHIAK